MSKKERTKEEKEFTRSRIVEAAERLIERQGFSNFSIRNLAKEMNYSTGIIYGNYENKNEILYEIIRKKFTSWNDEIQSMDLNSMEPKEALFQLLKKTVNFHQSQGKVSREIMITLIKNKQSYLGLTKGMMNFGGILKCTLERCLTGEHAEEDVIRRYSYLFIATQGLVLKLISDGELTDKEQYIDEYIHRIIDGLLSD